MQFGESRIRMSCRAPREAIALRVYVRLVKQRSRLESTWGFLEQKSI